MSNSLFAVSTICSVHNLEHEFIRSLQAEGLISITHNEEGDFIEEEQLADLELYSRWHHDLGINPEGIDVVRHLLQQVKEMQSQIALLKDRLKIYERLDDYI